jgi:hypothetical protein
MDEDLLCYSWDLLSFKEKSPDLYRAHVWHAEFSYDKWNPCRYLHLLGLHVFNFCMMNIVNWADNGEHIIAPPLEGDALLVHTLYPEGVREIGSSGSFHDPDFRRDVFP